MAGPSDGADIAAVLALGAALFIAIGDVMHQRSAHEVTGSAGRPRRFVPPVAAGPGAGGWVPGGGRHRLRPAGAALGLGSVLLVQALLVTSLLLRALPIQRVSAASPAYPLGVDLGCSCWALAVAVIVTVGDPTEGHSQQSFGYLGAGGRGPRHTAGGVRVVVRQRGAAARPAPCCWRSCPGGIWGVFAVLTKGVVHLLGDGIGAAAAFTGALCLGGGGDGGIAWQQSSFRAGALTASLGMAISEPMVASLLGVVRARRDAAPGRCRLAGSGGRHRGDGGGRPPPWPAAKRGCRPRSRRG